MSQTLEAAKREFRETYPNLRVHGWDERDYKLWSEIRNLPSYGLLAADDKMISLKQVLELLSAAAETRFEAQWRADALAEREGKAE